MPISRTDTTIYRGPAMITYDSVVFYAAGDIRVVTRTDTFFIPGPKGPMDERLKQVVTEVTFKPTGLVSANTLAKLLPHTAAQVGSSAVPATDKSLTIHPINGKELIVYNNALVSKMPDLILHPTETAFGEVTFTAFGTNNEALSATTHLFTLTATSAFSDTSLAATNHPTVPYTAVLGALSSPWNALKSRDGFRISFDIGIEEDVIDDVGIFDFLYSDRSTVTVRCKPIGVTVADLHGLMNLQGTGQARGMSILNEKFACVIATATVGGISLTVNNCLLKAAGHNYPMGKGHRVEDLEFVSTRSFTSGAPDALYAATVVAA